MDRVTAWLIPSTLSFITPSKWKPNQSGAKLYVFSVGEDDSFRRSRLFLNLTLYLKQRLQKIAI